MPLLTTTERVHRSDSSVDSPALPVHGVLLSPRVAATRLASVDVYRGFVMLLLLAEVLHFCGVSDALPYSKTWSFLCYEQSHVPWVGAALHDLGQPSFYFLV